MIFLLNADRGGADSVQHMIEQGKVTHLQCSTYLEFDKHVKDLIAQGAGPDDVVILDTLSRLADTTRGDMKLGVDPNEDYWSKKGLYLGGDKNYLTVYEAAGQFIMRRIRNLNARGFRIITIAHEDEQLDPRSMVKKRAPQMNEALYKSLLGSCTDCFRLSALHEAELGPSGNVVTPAGTRILQTTMDDEAICKYQVTPTDEGEFPTVPKYIAQPTMRKIFKVLRKKPSWLTIYGEPGAGKTTLAVSEAFTPKVETKEKATKA